MLNLANAVRQLKMERDQAQRKLTVERGFEGSGQSQRSKRKAWGWSYGA